MASDTTRDPRDDAIWDAAAEIAAHIAAAALSGVIHRHLDAVAPEPDIEAGARALYEWVDEIGEAHDSRWHELDEGSRSEFRRDVRPILDAALGGTRDGWTPVSERLPQAGMGVLTCLAGGRRLCESYWTGDGWYSNPVGGYVPVTHWRALPPLPETGGDDGR